MICLVVSLRGYIRKNFNAYIDKMSISENQDISGAQKTINLLESAPNF